MFAGAVLYRSWHGGITVDEPSHLVSAHVYWQGGHTLPPRDMPPLIRIVGGWPARVWPLPVPAGLGHAGDERLEWAEAVQMMDKMTDRESVRKVFFWARASLIVFPVGVLLLVWRWGRTVFGPVAGLTGMAALALEPTFRGHSGLFKNDIAATFGYLAFWYACWRYWGEPGTRRGLFVGVAAATAILAKLSMLVVIPLGFAVLLVRAAMERKVRWVPLLALPLLPWLLSLAAAPQEVSRITGWSLDHLRAAYGDSIPVWLTAAGQIFRVIPVSWPMWEGVVSLFIGNTESNAVYLLGEVEPRGVWNFFLVALAVKTPVPVLALCAVGVTNSQRREAFWLLAFGVYFAACSVSALQYGVRLALPCYPFLALAAAAGAHSLLQWRGQILLAALGGWLLWTSVRSFGTELAYFNEVAGGPDKGLVYLADSNLDWGQALPELREYFDRTGARPMRVSYWGTDNPYRFFNDKEIETIAPPWSLEVTQGKRQLQPEPGIYAISANLLPGHFFPAEFRDYYAAFRRLQPVARPGHAIYIYEIRP